MARNCRASSLRRCGLVWPRCAISMIRFARTSRMAPAYDGLESVPPDLWTASQAPSNAEASILIASGSNEEFAILECWTCGRAPLLTDLILLTPATGILPCEISSTQLDQAWPFRRLLHSL